MQDKYTSYIKYYLLLLFFFSIIFLHQKHNSVVDWTISEWLINYQGGFTRRGFLGEISLLISKILQIEIRDSIMFLQIFFITSYYMFFYTYIKKIYINHILFFAIFSPLFLSYPIAELEVLGRKEIFLLLSYLLIIYLFDIKNRNKFSYIFLSIITFLNVLIWEGIIFYITFFILVVLTSNKFLYNKFDLKNIFLSFIPFILAFFLIINFKLNNHQIEILCKSINECYGAIGYLNNSLESNINEVTSKFKIQYFIRYFFIVLIGFMPILFITFNSKFNNRKIIFKFDLKILLLFCIFPTIFFFIIAQDWARWINICYSMSLLYIFYCLKNEILNIKYYKNKLKIFNKKKISIFVFIIFAFGWNPKTLMNEDVGSIPLYRKANDVFKIFFIKN